MTISAGSRLGLYEILSPLGSGGMGEVWRARDARLSREVAIKVLPEGLTSDPDRLRRFEKEARSASSLNHPNIVTIHEIGIADSVSFIVMELVEGKTLRGLLADGRLPVRRLLPIATQIAEGIAKAHEAGIVHRDLKPENVMVTKDGHVKILDFGLAKLARPESDSGQTDSALTVSEATRPGIAMGTAGYMSPEQASGHPVDFRSDQFSFGSILYEMVTGKQAFRRATTAQTLAAIIQDDPEPIPVLAPKTPAPLRWVVERCMAKEPEARYAATRDLVRDLTNLRDHLSELSSGSGAIITAPLRLSRRRLLAAGAVALLLAGIGIAVVASRGRSYEPPFYRRMTFRRGDIEGARFSPDGQTVVYSGGWDGKPMQLFSTRVDSTESTALPLPSSDILSISPSGQMAIGVQRDARIPWGGPQTLAEVSLAGGTPREILEDVTSADWSPDRRSLAIVRNERGLEFPIGKVLYQSASGFLAFPRFSPDGRRIAFAEAGPDQYHEASIAVVDLEGKRTVLTTGWEDVLGLAWHPRTGEVWFTAREMAVGRGPLAIHSVSAGGRHRTVARGALSLLVKDVSRDGRVLLANTNFMQSTVCLPPGAAREVDLSWHDFSSLNDFSDDGTAMVFVDVGHATGSVGAIYFRRTDGSPAIRLGEGIDAGLSPDKRWVTAIPSTVDRLFLLPTAAGERRDLTTGKMSYVTARWLPDGKRILFLACESERPARLYIQDVSGGPPRAITPEGFGMGRVSPDGRFVAARGPDGKVFLYPIEGGEPRVVPGVGPGENILRWDASGNALFLSDGHVPARIERFDLATGRREPWKELGPADPAGVAGVDVRLTADGKSYAYWYLRELDDLYVVDGLR